MVPVAIFSELFQRNRIGGKPLGGQHRPLDFFLRGDQGHVERITVNPICGVRNPRGVVQGGIKLGGISPRHRQNQICRQQPDLPAGESAC